MGNWYTNVSRKDVNPTGVLAQLNELDRVAMVAPSASGWLVVFDQECEKFDLDTLESLALTLSTRLHCTALASFNAADDILWLAFMKMANAPPAMLHLPENLRIAANSPLARISQSRFAASSKSRRVSAKSDRFFAEVAASWAC